MGNHIFASLYGISFKDLNNLEKIQQAFEDAVETMGATVLNRFAHQFQPQGVTIVYALAESHISIHTFPENGCCAIDVYTCGDMNSKLGIDVLVKCLNPLEVPCITEVKR